MTSKVLVVETEPDLLNQVSELLRGAGHEVMTATDGEQGWAVFVQNNLDAVISGLRMPNLDGLGLLRRVRSRSKEIPVVLLAKEIHQDSEPQAESLGVTAFVYIPLQNPADLLRWIGA